MKKEFSNNDELNGFFNFSLILLRFKSRLVRWECDSVTCWKCSETGRFLLFFVFKVERVINDDDKLPIQVIGAIPS